MKPWVWGLVGLGVVGVALAAAAGASEPPRVGGLKIGRKPPRPKRPGGGEPPETGESGEASAPKSAEIIDCEPPVAADVLSVSTGNPWGLPPGDHGTVEVEIYENGAGRIRDQFSGAQGWRAFATVRPGGYAPLTGGMDGGAWVLGGPEHPPMPRLIGSQFADSPAPPLTRFYDDRVLYAGWKLIRSGSGRDVDWWMVAVWDPERCEVVILRLVT